MLKLILLPNNFPPKRGGIATWMYSICRYMDADEINCFVESTEDCSNVDRQNSFNIIRVGNPGAIHFQSLIKHLNQVIRILWMNRNLMNRDLSLSSVLSWFFCLMRMNFVQLKYSVLHINSILTQINHLKGHIVLCGTVLPPGLTAYFLSIFFQIPYAVIAHGDEIIRWQKHNNYRHIAKIVFQNSSLIIANSHYTQRLLNTIDISNTKIRIVHPGVDTKAFFPRKINVGKSNPYRFRNSKIILSVGSLIPRKGHDAVIKALEHVLKNEPHAHFVIAGDGPYRADLKSMVANLGLEQHVTFTGEVEDHQLQDLLNMCSVFIMPSRHTRDSVEGFGIVFIEANACAKPVIGGNSGGIEDAIINGHTGFVVNPCNYMEIAEKIILLLQNQKLAKKMGMNGMNRAIKYFDWPIVIKQLRQVLIDGLIQNH